MMKALKLGDFGLSKSKKGEIRVAHSLLSAPAHSFGSFPRVAARHSHAPITLSGRLLGNLFKPIAVIHSDKNAVNVWQHI
jgi:hypothetical protein